MKARRIPWMRDLSFHYEYGKYTTNVNWEEDAAQLENIKADITAVYEIRWKGQA